MKAISYTAQATRALMAIPGKDRQRLMTRLKAHAAGEHAGVVKRLKGEPTMRIRAGDYRMIFEDDGASILVLAAGHRRDIYR